MQTSGGIGKIKAGRKHSRMIDTNRRFVQPWVSLWVG
jgi:hypothetical protein